MQESCIRDEIVDHLVANSLINDSQHGFMKNRSCTTNLLEFLERLTLEQDAGHAMDVVYLDFSWKSSGRTASREMCSTGLRIG